MYSPIAFLCLFIAACQAGVISVDEGHHAVSSQSIVRHDQQHQIATPVHYSTPVYQHSAPILQHSAPILQHSAQILQHSSPILQHSSPILQHSSQILQHSSPILQHSAPIYQHAHVAHVAPVVEHSAPISHYTAPITTKVVTPITLGHAEHYEESAPAHYEFSYSVEDPHTGDHKSQHESRDGDVVKGEYSLLQPDGSIRKVEYTADHHNGFNAIVHNSAPSVHSAPAPAHEHVALHAAPLFAAHH